MTRQIDILPSYQINKEKWDACIENSASGLIYACSEYLDNLADNWYGIVINNYESVLPIPFRKKLGIRYCYDVPFVPQLGLFSSKSTIIDETLLSSIFSIVKYGDYNFNFLNQPARSSSYHHNYVLSLHKSYSELQKGFSRDTLTNIHKSQQEGFSYTSATIDETIDLFIQLYASRSPHVTRKIYERFRHTVNLLEKKGRTITRKVVNRSGQTEATLLLLRDKRRLYNIMNSTTIEGRKNEANYFLLSEVWKEFQQKELIFDFEGSDIKGIRKFYHKFGAENQPYRRLHFNHLPVLCKWLKK